VSSQQTDFYQSQANEARERSDAASLENVKVSQLRAAAAWEALAARSRKSDLLKTAESKRKAEQGLTSN
jgi:hypothetical protein